MQCQLLEHDIHPTYTGNTYLPPMIYTKECFCGEPMSKVTDHSIPSEKNYGEDRWLCANGHREVIQEPRRVTREVEEIPYENFVNSEQWAEYWNIVLPEYA